MGQNAKYGLKIKEKAKILTPQKTNQKKTNF